MAGYFEAIQIIAEQRILEAQERGEFEHLSGEGLPLPEEDLSAIPPEYRMAWRILKNSGFLPQEVAARKEASQLADLLESASDEKTRLKAMAKLRYLLAQIGSHKHAVLESQDNYYLKILALLEKHERRSS